MICPVLKQECLEDGCEWFMGHSCAVVKIASNSVTAVDLLSGLNSERGVHD
jgi:hypothetical protein